MLINIDPVLSPDLLYVLRAMGHRQDVAIVDANYPCDSTARIVRLDGVAATTVLTAVLSVLPIEADETAGAWRMIADGQPAKMLPIFDEFAGIIERAAPGRGLAAIDPGEFKARAGAGFATVVTGERRLYGSVIIRKGVIGPDR